MTIIPDYAIARYRVFYPKATRSDMREEAEAALEIEGPTASALVGRRATLRGSVSRYRLHQQRTGLFVLDGNRVVTFLRFYSLRQYDMACELWPGGLPLKGCTAKWVSTVRAREVPQVDKAERRRQKRQEEAERIKEHKEKLKAKRTRAGIKTAAEYLTRLGWSVRPPIGWLEDDGGET